MRKLIAFTMLLAGFLALIIGVGRFASGYQRGAYTPLFEPGNCAQPCWHGIQPQITTLAQAEYLLQSDVDHIAGIRRDELATGCALSWIIRTTPALKGCVNNGNGLVRSIDLATLRRIS